MRDFDNLHGVTDNGSDHKCKRVTMMLWKDGETVVDKIAEVIALYDKSL